MAFDELFRPLEADLSALLERTGMGCGRSGTGS
jgi:hypothetical protein